MCAICDYLKSISTGFMASQGEGHSLFQADLNKQLCTEYIINEKLIIPVGKHIILLLCGGDASPWGEAWMPTPPGAKENVTSPTPPVSPFRLV